MAALPYVTAPGNIERAFNGIKSAATPPRVNQDFVKTILKIPGGSGNQITAFLRKIGFVNQDGTASDIYKRFRNSATAGRAAAEALKIAYGPLYTRNEYMHQLTDEKLKGLIIEETGQGSDSSVVGLVLASIKAIKKYADWSDAMQDEIEKPSALALPPMQVDAAQIAASVGKGVGLNLSYTINLNLPPTTDVAVFNAIFKSLKENLLKNE
jgi:hypothetical protein